MQHHIDVLRGQVLGVLGVGYLHLGHLDVLLRLTHTFMLATRDVIVYLALMLMDRLLGRADLVARSRAKERGLVQISFRALLGVDGTLGAEFKRGLRTCLQALHHGALGWVAMATYEHFLLLIWHRLEN